MDAPRFELGAPSLRTTCSTRLSYAPFSLQQVKKGFIKIPARQVFVATIEDLHKLDIRVGTIITAEDFPEARKPAYKLTIDFGPLGTKKSSAQITRLYTKDALIGKQIAAVVNFPPRQIGPFISEVLVLGATSESHPTILLRPERDSVPGDKIA